MTEEGEGNDGGPQPRRPWVPASAGTTEREAGTTIGVGDDGRGKGVRGSRRPWVPASAGTTYYGDGNDVLEKRGKGAMRSC